MEKALDTWWTGQVTRKHTMRNLRAENVAEHTWGVMHLLLHVWPDCPKQTVIYAQYHDSGEEAVGDVPATTKWANQGLGQILDGLETDSLKKLLSEDLFEMWVSAGDLDRLVVEFCDRMEFCYSMIREWSMGNSFAREPFLRSFNKARAALEEIHSKVLGTGYFIISLRCEDLFKLLKEEPIYGFGE